MGRFAVRHWLVVLAVVLLLFGGHRKIGALMDDVAEGVRSFRGGMAPRRTDAAPAAWPRRVLVPLGLWLVALVLALLLASGQIDDLARWLHGAAAHQ
jgi:TatA/E family protein of Tat protein translocase